MFGLKRKNLVLGLAIFFTSVASSQSMAKERTTFDDSTASPRGNLTIKNGQSITFSAVLKAGTKGVPKVPVNVYIGSDPTPNQVKTDSNGRFTLTKTVWITDKIPSGGKSLNWCADFAGDSTYVGASTCNYIHGWRFTVKP